MGVEDQLGITVRREADRVVVDLDGELDMASAPLLQSALDGAEIEPDTMVVLDLQSLQFIDSTGLRAILSLRDQCRERAQQFAVTRGSPQVQRLLDITGVSEHLQTPTA
jgi:anti-sigma B factor antagonist